MCETCETCEICVSVSQFGAKGVFRRVAKEGTFKKDNPPQASFMTLRFA